VKLDIIAHNWRCFQNTHLAIPSQSFVISDQNGSGKTSILAAIYSLYTGNPWPGTKFSESLSDKSPYYGLMTGYPEWSLTGQIGPSGRLSNKHQKPVSNPLSSTKIWPKVFTYLPTDNGWLGMSRSSKLGVLDGLLCLCYEGFEANLKRLDKLAKSKSQLIKHSFDTPESVDEALVVSLSQEIFVVSQLIWSVRSGFFDEVGSRLGGYEGWIQSPLNDWGIRHEISDFYGNKRSWSDVSPELSSHSPDWLKLWQKEMIVGKVLFGAQRDDFSINSGHKSAQSVLSRGEMRLLVLFIKLLSQEICLKLNPGVEIMWLLDDVFNEFDDKREMIFFEELLKSCSYFVVTTTKKLELDIPSLSLAELTTTRN
jgi:recombinational DNA repair ATPase RecF